MLSFSAARKVNISSNKIHNPSSSKTTRLFSTDKPAILLPKDVDVSKLIFKPTKVLKTTTGPRIIHVNYETDNRLLRIQTPALTVPFGLSKRDDEKKAGNKLFLMSVAFDALETNPEQKKFYDLINSLDAQIIAAAQREAKVWFDKDTPSSVLEHNYKKSIKITEKYPPLMKLKIPVEIDRETKQPIPRAHVWVDKNQVSIDEIVNRCKTVNIIELKYIWAISTSMLGATWGLLQSKIVERPLERLSNYSFIETKPNPTQVTKP